MRMVLLNILVLFIISNKLHNFERRLDLESYGFSASYYIDIISENENDQTAQKQAPKNPTWFSLMN